MNKINWTRKYDTFHVCKDGKGTVLFRLDREGTETHKCDRCGKEYPAHSPTAISA